MNPAEKLLSDLFWLSEFTHFCENICPGFKRWKNRRINRRLKAILRKVDSFAWEKLGTTSAEDGPIWYIYDLQLSSFGKAFKGSSIIISGHELSWKLHVIYRHKDIFACVLQGPRTLRKNYFNSNDIDLDVQIAIKRLFDNLYDKLVSA
jgi:hypothetical protein